MIIPSCSDREDTVHPQWLLDSVSTNWLHEGPSRRLTGNRLKHRHNGMATDWKPEEKALLVKEMAKYGRNVRKISQTLKTKTEAEIQALIEAEYGVHLDTPTFGLEKQENLDDVPNVVQEEIVTDDMNILNMVATGTPTVSIPKKPFGRKSSKNSLLRPDALSNKKNTLEINPSDIYYEDEMIIGSTESVGSDMDSVDMLSRKMAKQHKEKVKAMKKIGNHRRKVSRNYDRGKRNSSKEVLKSPSLGRQRKDSSLSEDSVKSPKMQIVFSSGQALPVSEGEQVIKIEKKKDSEPDSDIEVDIDSDEGDSSRQKRTELTVKKIEEEPIAVPLRKLQPMPKRPKKINLSGDGGFTIMHTEAGDLYEVGAEPKKERTVKKPAPPPVHLIQCRLYSTDRPAPYSVRLHVSCLIAMDAHSHTSRAEVMGLAGGRVTGSDVTITAYRRAAAAAGSTHCDMDPLSQAAAAESLRSMGLVVCAWHHSHPAFPPSPSALDLHTQKALQQALERSTPLLGLITSQHWAPGRDASQYRCIRVEDSDLSESDTPEGYQFSVKLLPDLTIDNLPDYLLSLRDTLCGGDKNEYSVDMVNDVCPQAGKTYLEKCISSVSHHMRSAGYEDDDPVTKQLIQGLRDVFR
ncbi:histone H2A deubiquitinase MYSM1 isoform X1 [Phthorimaea operculella]|nr:histone H2A deubiquitinase MYSM1 isoform X1 [Phthorimaea operculella]